MTLVNLIPSGAELFGVTDVAVIAAIGALVSWGVIRSLLWYSTAKRATVRPEEFHHAPADETMPRLGGLAFAAAFVVSGLVLAIIRGWHRLLSPDALEIFLPSLAMFAVGFWDDLRPLGAKKKLGLQIIVALLAYGLGLQVNTLKNPFSGEIYNLHYLSIGLTVLWLVAMTNLVNLIDGIDGLAGGVALMLMALLAYVSLNGAALHLVVAVSMVGALAAFLRFNFPPARVFMGDGGAYFLGFLIGAVTIANSQKGTVLAALLAPIIALGLPIIDTLLAIIRRGLDGLPLFRADRKHIHHRLMQHGLSRTQTVLLLYAVSIAFLLMAFAMFWSERRFVPIVFGLVFLVFLFVLQGRAIGLNWLTAGRVIGNSPMVRRQTQYIMALSFWLEMEAERSKSLDALWEDFTFVVRKVGFTRVKVVLSNGHRTWTSADHATLPTSAEHIFEFNLGERIMFFFQCNNGRLDETILKHLSELAAEAWLKAARRWSKRTGQPLQFGPEPTGLPVTHSAEADAA